MSKLPPSAKVNIGWPWTTETDPSLYIGAIEWPKISIITPSFNQGQYIEETIRSVLLQNYPNLEYIIIDGGSTDNTVEVIKKYEPWLTYWVNEPDKGQSHAINKGIQMATGDIINWLNSDDYYEPGALKTVAENFKPGIHCVAGRSKIFDKNDVKFYSRGTDIYQDNLAKTIGWARIDQPETFFSREAWEVIGVLNTDLHYIFDREWWIRYLSHFGLNNVRAVSDILVNFRHHEDSKTISQRQCFNKESISLFASLAKKSTNNKASHYLNELNINFTVVKFNIYNQFTSELLDQILNYFLLLKANEFYALNDKSTTNIYLSLVNPNCLASEDLRLYKRLRNRNKFPSAFLKLARRLSEKS